MIFFLAGRMKREERHQQATKSEESRRSGGDNGDKLRMTQKKGEKKGIVSCVLFIRSEDNR